MKNTILVAILGLGFIALPAQADSVHGWGGWNKGSIGSLQADILAGSDPTADAEPTAAGPSGPAFSAFTTPTTTSGPKSTLVVSTATTTTTLTRQQQALAQVPKGIVPPKNQKP